MSETPLSQPHPDAPRKRIEGKAPRPSQRPHHLNAGKVIKDITREASGGESPGDSLRRIANVKPVGVQARMEEENVGAGKDIHVSEMSMTEPLESAQLDEKAKEEVRILLQYEKENSDFLDPKNPMVQKLQSYVDQIKDPNFPRMRVLISLNDLESNGYVLEDGTMVLSQALINDMDFEEELVAIMAHEQVHFEKQHHKKGKASENDENQGFFSRTMRSLGKKRSHEYHADLALTAKLDTLGVDTLSFESAIQKIGRRGAEANKGKKKSRPMDFVHGAIADRALNTILAHNLIDFPSSVNTTESRTPIDSSWKREIQPSVMQRLTNPSSEKEWEDALKEAPPLVFQDYMANLVSKAALASWRGNVPFDRQRRSRRYLRRLDKAMELIDSRLAEGGLKGDRKRQALLLCATSGIGKEYGTWEHVSDQNKRVSIPLKQFKPRADLMSMIKQSDFSAETMASLLDMHQEGKIYEQVGLFVPKERDIFPTELLLADQYPGNLVGGLVESLSVKMSEGFTPTNSSEASIYSVADTLYAMRGEIASRYGDEKANKWFRRQIRPLMLHGVRDYSSLRDIHRDNLTEDMGNTLKAFSERYGFHFSTSILREIATDTHNKRLLRRMDGSVFDKTLAHFVNKLRPVDENFSALFETHNTDVVIEYMEQNPEEFHRQLAYFKQRGKSLTEETKTWFLQSVVDNYDHLLTDGYKGPLSQNQDLEGLQGVADVKDVPEQEVQRFAKISYALRTVVLATSGERIEERAAQVIDLFNNPRVQENLKHLSIVSLDSLSRYVIRETQTGEGSHTTERRFDVKRPDYSHNPRPWLELDSTPRVTADQLVHLPVFGLLRDKLLTANHDAGFIESLQMHDYYTKLLGKYYRYERDSNFWGESTDMSQEVVPMKTKLLESFGKFDYLNAPVDEVSSYYETVRRVLPSEYESGEILNALAGQIIEKSSFTDALQFMEALAEENNIGLDLVNIFIEKRVNTFEDYQKCKDSIARVVDGYITETPAKTGILALIDTIIDYKANYINMPYLLETMLLSGNDDTEFRRRMAPHYWSYVTKAGDLNGYDFKADGRRLQVEGPGAHTFHTFNEFIDKVQGLSDFQKMNMLRKVFLQENGILDNPEYRKKTVEMFMGQLQKDPTLTPLLTNIMAATLDSGDPVRMFLPIANSLAPFIFRRPQVPGDNKPAAEAVHEMGKGNYIANVGIEKSAWTKEEIEKILNMSKAQMQADVLTGQPATAEIFTAYQAYLQSLKESIGFTSAREVVESNNEDIPPIEIILRFGQAMGPVGVRFLQVLGQYVDLPPGYQDRFRDVYDSMPGQSKYSAFAMLDNEARKDPKTQEFLENEFVSLDEKLGGGSIMTTFAMTTHDEKDQLVEEVLKVKNPNSERFVIETIVEARKVVEDLRTRDAKNTANYTVAGRMLDTIEQWVLGDIKDDTFMQLDPFFAELHNGFQAKAGPIIEIGRVGEPNNSNLKRERRTLGNTLNKLLKRELQPEAHPVPRRAISAIAEDFALQLTKPVFFDADGKPVYLVHSDIHPGNEIVGPGGDTVHPIDRNYYLQLSQEDVAFVHGVLSDAEPQQKLGIMVSYFLAQPENAQHRLQPGEVTAEIYKSIFRSEAINRLRGRESSKLELMNKVLHELDKRGIEVPLRLRIMNKNLDSVNNMLETVKLGSFLSYLNEAMVN